MRHTRHTTRKVEYSNLLTTPPNTHDTPPNNWNYVLALAILGNSLLLVGEGLQLSRNMAKFLFCHET